MSSTTGFWSAEGQGGLCPIIRNLNLTLVFFVSQNVIKKKIGPDMQWHKQIIIFEERFYTSKKKKKAFCFFAHEAFSLSINVEDGGRELYGDMHRESITPNLGRAVSCD